jgi:26S proteasome regulatory subunit T4
MTTLTIMRILPREVDPMVYKMSLEDPGGASFAGIGGLGEQVRELREVRSYPFANHTHLTPHSLRSSSSPS